MERDAISYNKLLIVVFTFQLVTQHVRDVNCEYIFIMHFCMPFLSPCTMEYLSSTVISLILYGQNYKCLHLCLL